MYSLPPANEVCEGIVFTGVCLSGGSQSGGGAFLSRGLCRGGGVGVQRDLCWGGLCPGGSLYPPYGKERAVRILLECNLVFKAFIKTKIYRNLSITHCKH